jgi:hypothetical protein
MLTGSDYLFQVVEHEQIRSFAQCCGQSLEDWHTASLMNLEHLCDRWDNERGIAKRGQSNECMLDGGFVRHRRREARLPDSTRPGQGDKPHVGIAQQPRDVLYLAPAPDQRRELGR